MSDCVPYAIHVATGLPMATVEQQCKSFGWTEADGMTPVGGWLALQALGYSVEPMTRPAGRITLKRFIPTLDRERTYIIDVNSHWFCIRAGKLFDKALTSSRTEVIAFFAVSSSSAEEAAS